MSSAGIQCFDPAGRKVFDITDLGALFVGSASVPAGSGTFQQAFPSIAGRNASFMVAGVVRDQGVVPPTVVMTFPGGVPTVNAAKNPATPYSVYVFAR